MNKAVGIGIIIAAIVGIVILSISMNSESEEDSVPEELPLEESISAEPEIEIIEKTGRDLSVELSESIGLTAP